MIDRKSPTPLYIQLADSIRNQIARGEIKPGDKLKSETEMIDLYQLGRLTIREALSLLVNEGILQKRHGKGTFCISTPENTKKLKFDIMLDMKDVYFVPYYLRSICKAFENENCEVLIHDTKSNSSTICKQLEKVLSNGSNGVIIQPSNKKDDNTDELSSKLLELIKFGIPYVLLDGNVSGIPNACVTLNETSVGELAASCFKQYGHKHLCMICAKLNSDSDMRLSGFSSRLINPPIVVNYDDNMEETLINTLSEHPEISGIFCYNDLVAKKCVSTLISNGYIVPDNISVISVDDTVIASTIIPPLTSIQHPKEKLGEEAAQILLDISKHKITWPKNVVFEPTLKIRKSVSNR